MPNRLLALARSLHRGLLAPLHEGAESREGVAVIRVGVDHLLRGCPPELDHRAAVDVGDDPGVESRDALVERLDVHRHGAEHGDR